MMHNLLIFIAGAVWCLIGLLLVVGITAIIKLKPRPTSPLPSALPKEEIAWSAPWEKFKDHGVHSESPGWEKVFDTHREPRNVFHSPRVEQARFVSRVRLQKCGNKRVTEPKHNTRTIPRVRTYALEKEYEPTVPMTTEHA